MIILSFAGSFLDIVLVLSLAFHRVDWKTLIVMRHCSVSIVSNNYKAFLCFKRKRFLGCIS